MLNCGCRASRSMFSCGCGASKSVFHVKLWLHAKQEHVSC